MSSVPASVQDPQATPLWTRPLHVALHMPWSDSVSHSSPALELQALLACPQQMTLGTQLLPLLSLLLFTQLFNAGLNPPS